MAEIIHDKAPIILKHLPGELWSAHLLAMEECMAEGPTPEAAIEALIPEIKYFLERSPDLRKLIAQSQFLLTEVELP